MRAMLVAAAILAGGAPAWGQSGEFGAGRVLLDRLGRVALFDRDTRDFDGDGDSTLVAIDGRVRFAFAWGDWHRIVDAFPSRTRPRIVLIGYGAGNACAAAYGVVDLSARAPVFVEAIGDCNVSAYLWTGTQILFRNVRGDAWSYSTANRLESFPMRERARHVAEGFAAFRRGDFDAAARRLWALGDRQWPEAPYALGRMSERGRGMPLDPDDAAGYYQFVIEHRHAPSAYRLAPLLERGRGGPPDPKWAISLLHKAANKGYALAQMDLGTRYLRGRGLDADPFWAAVYLTWASESSDPNLNRAILRHRLSAARRALSPDLRAAIPAELADLKSEPANAFEGTFEPWMWVGYDPFARIRGRTFLEHGRIAPALLEAFGVDGRDRLDEMDDLGEPIVDRGGLYVLRGCAPRFCANGKFRLAVWAVDTVRVAGCLDYGRAAPDDVKIEAVTGRARRERRGGDPAVDMPLCDADDETFARLARELIAR